MTFKNLTWNPEAANMGTWKSILIGGRDQVASLCTVAIILASARSVYLGQVKESARSAEAILQLFCQIAREARNLKLKKYFVFQLAQIN